MPNSTSAITAEAPKIRDQRALALVVAGGAPHEPPQPVQPRGQRQRDEQRDEDAEERDHDPEHVRIQPVVDLRADPQPRQRLRAPDGEAEERLGHQQRRGEHAVQALPAPASALRRVRGSAAARSPGGAR